MINQIDVAAGTWRAFAQDLGCELQCAKSQQVFSKLSLSAAWCASSRKQGPFRRQPRVGRFSLP